MNLIATILFLLIQPSWAQSGANICDVVDLRICNTSSGAYGVLQSRSSMKSMPSLSSSSMMNPATVNFNRGFGVELIYQVSNPINIAIASGTGRMGGAIVSNSQENTFFGNHTYELQPNLEERIANKKQFKPKKISGAFGIGFIDTRYLEFDVGLMLKRHNEIKKINLGLGISGRLWIFNYGAAFYNDDTSLGSASEENLILKYKVKTYSIGTQFGRMTFDAGRIETDYSDNNISTINLYSTSYSLGRFLFNYAYKVEHYIPINGGDYETKKSMFGGVQVSLGKNLITGVNYNYFDLDEISYVMTLFF